MDNRNYNRWITGASAGSGSTIDQTLTNPSNSTAGTVQYLVTPTSTAGSCAGATYTITVTVNPAPVVTTANTKSVCSGSSTNISLTSSDIEFIYLDNRHYNRWYNRSKCGFGFSDQSDVDQSKQFNSGYSAICCYPHPAASCAGAAYTITVTVIRPFSKPSSNSPVNYGNTINLSATITGGTSPHTTTWSGPTVFLHLFKTQALVL